jgi:hypothetical protein
MPQASNQFGTWQSWQPREVAQFFSTLTVPWWIAGGWALDLFLGERTRDHEDIDVLFIRRDQQEIQGLLQGWDVQEAHPEMLPGSWPFHEWKQGTPLSPEVHDIWCRPKKTSPWAIQLMVIDIHDDQWIFRHNIQISRSLSTIGYVTDEGIPYLAPEIQLLYKARSPRPKDEADFARVLPYLDQRSRRWLTWALGIVYPHHSWLLELGG